MKKLFALVLVLAMCLSITACGSESTATTPAATTPETTAPAATTPDASIPATTPSADKPIRMLYAVTTMTSNYFNDSYNAFKPIMAENGFEIVMDAPPQKTAEAQLAHLENAITSGEWDVILCYADVPEAMKSIVPLADQNGVKVIGYCQNAQTNMGHIYYGTDTTQQGEMCAQMAIDYVDHHPELYAEFDENHKIPYAIMANYDNPQVNARNEASKALLEKDGRFEEVFEQKVTNQEEGMAFGENLAITYPDIKIILGASDSTALSVMEAMDIAGYGDDKSVAIFSHDCVTKTRESIRNGGLLRGSGYAPYEVVAQDIMNVARKLLAGEEFDLNNMPYMHCYGITIENIDEFFPDGK
ncbi:MAG: substrate-binding domain-containing protein [Lachnospiraceae bacterium]|nr:substrate-binding domain-containing protein [Lachnospiraceae bacterium]